MPEQPDWIRRATEDIMSHVKFFPRDVINGEVKKPGDRFTAMFMAEARQFEVTEHYGTFWFAKLLPKE